MLTDNGILLERAAQNQCFLRDRTCWSSTCMEARLDGLFMYGIASRPPRARLAENRRHYEGLDQNRDVGDVDRVLDNRALGSRTEGGGGPIEVRSGCSGG